MKKRNRLMRSGLFVTAAWGLAGLRSAGAAEGEPVDKSQYHLFNPTPAALMREMSTDRPDKTESAYPVDAGHFQIESDLVSYSYDHDTEDGANTRVDAWAVAAINFKVGLLNNVDLRSDSQYQYYTSYYTYYSPNNTAAPAGNKPEKRRKPTAPGQVAQASPAPSNGPRGD